MACLNSMHSRSKIQRKYPWILPYLPLLYGQSKHASIRSNNGTVMDGEAFMQTDSRQGSTDSLINFIPIGTSCSMSPFSRFKNLNMTQFYLDTLPDIYLPFCEYHRFAATLREILETRKNMTNDFKGTMQPKK